VAAADASAFEEHPDYGTIRTVTHLAMCRSGEAKPGRILTPRWVLLEVEELGLRDRAGCVDPGPPGPPKGCAWTM